MMMGIVRNQVKVAYDIKRNYMTQILEEYDKKYLRLKIVQHQKRHIPHQLLQMDGGNGLKFDADQLSMSGTSAYSESQFSSFSGKSGMSGISETSKKSKRQGAIKKQ